MRRASRLSPCPTRGAPRLRAAAVATALAACSGGLSSSSAVVAGAPVADVDDPIPGVPDPGVDPAVVALVAGQTVACAGTLVAADVVLTALACVSPAAACAAAISPADRQAAQSLVVYVGDDAATATPRAGVRDLAPPPSDGAGAAPPAGGACGGAMALLLLDAPIDDVEPLVVRATGAAQGDHVRSVTFGPGAGGVSEKRVRDHVAVTGATSVQLALDETPCGLGCGGPVVDPTTAEVVGVLTGSLVEADAGADVAARADVARSWIDAVVAQSAGAASGAQKTKKGNVDFGASCAGAAGCAAGVCVSEPGERYCSRRCSPDDRCPTSSRCETSTGGALVCVED